MKRAIPTILSIFAFVVSINADTASFRFALFTDMHIAATNPIPTADLTAAVQEVNGMGDIAFVVVTGDITESGDIESLQLAKRLLDELQMPYYATVGNHETKWSESGTADFESVFGSARFLFQYGEYLFMGLNSSPTMHMAHGHIAWQEREWVAQKLTLFSPETPLFVCTHYPLQPGDVDNWHELTDLLKHHNTQAVLGGHYHRNMLLNYDQIPGVLHRSTLRGNESVGGYTIIQVGEEYAIFSEKCIGVEPVIWLQLPLGPKEYDIPIPRNE